MWTKLPRGLPWQGELINRRKNGQVYTENASLYPVRDVFGEVTHYVAHMEDITQRRGVRVGSGEGEAIDTMRPAYHRALLCPTDESADRMHGAA